MIRVPTANLSVVMLTRGSLLGKLQSAECLARRRLLDVDTFSLRQRSDASASIKLAGLRSRGSGEQLSADRLKSSSEGLAQRNTDRNDIFLSTQYAGREAEGFLGESSKTTAVNLDISENVEACFSSSSLLSLVPRDVDEAHTQHETPLGDKSPNLPATYHDQLDSIARGPERSRRIGETALAKIWKRKKEERRIGGLLLLNGLAAVYGSSNVANKYVAESAPALPASMISLVKFTSALIFFIPSLFSALKNRETDLLRAGAELGALAFAASFVDSLNPGSSSSSSPALLYGFTVVFVPLMELLAGRQSGLKLPRLATLAAAILGMGLLEEEGIGWKGISCSCPQIDLWGVAVSAILTLHIFRSDAHGQKFDPLRLNAVQCGVLAILSLGWELWNTFDASALQSHVINHFDSLQSIPWVPLLYNGVVCSGLCSLLELRGLRAVHASTATLVYTTIPVWGAFLSSFSDTSHDVPTDSAMIGGLVILATSIYAHVISKDDDLKLKVEAQSRSTATSTPESNSTSTQSSKEKTEAVPKENYYFPASLIVSQLKFPYYAAQAKGLLAEIKFKLGAFKTMGLAFTGMSNSNVLITSTSAATTATTTTITTAATATGPNNLTTSYIGAAASHAIDASNIAAAVHGTDLATTTAMMAAHSVSNVFAGLPTSITIANGFESALVAAGSDVVMAVEEAENVATILERLVQAGADSAVHLVTAWLMAGGSLEVIMINSGLTEVDPTPRVEAMTNFVETAPQLAVDLDTQLDLLMNLSHVTDMVVNGFCHLILPLVNNTTAL